MKLEETLAGTKYVSKLDIIKKHSENVFKKDVFYHKYFTLHGMDHSNAIISTLDRLVDGINHNNELTKPEIFYLLASVYLHDVGMLISYPDDEEKAKARGIQKKRTLTKEDIIRKEHHVRSGKYHRT